MCLTCVSQPPMHAGRDEALAHIMVALRDIQMRVHQLTAQQEERHSNRPSLLTRPSMPRSTAHG